LVLLRKISLDFDDIEPLERAFSKYASLGSGLVFYKGDELEFKLEDGKVVLKRKRRG